MVTPQICFRSRREAQVPALAPHEPASHANAILDDFGYSLLNERA
jgi:hypothetical protein